MKTRLYVAQHTETKTERLIRAGSAAQVDHHLASAWVVRVAKPDDVLHLTNARVVLETVKAAQVVGEPE